MTPKHRSVFVFILATSLLPLGLAGCNQASGTSHGPPRKAPSIASTTRAEQDSQRPTVTVQTVHPQHFSSQIQATGTALAIHSGYLSMPVPGRIQRILVKRGQKVRKGQVLLRLDSRSFALQVQQAEAGLAGAKVSERTTKRELERITTLRKSEAVAGAALDKVQAQYDGAVAQRAMASAGFLQAKKALHDATLRAPFSGVVVDVMKEEGEFAPAMPPTPLIRLVDSSSLEVQTFLPEQEAPYIKQGMKARVQIDSVGVEQEGQVVFVSDSIDPKVQSFEVRVRVPNPQGEIKAGAFARISLQRRELERALLIPKQAVSRDSNDQPYVLAVVDGVLKKLPVTLGERTEKQVLVREGISPGQTIVTAGVTELREGQQVQVNATRGES